MGMDGGVCGTHVVGDRAGPVLAEGRKGIYPGASGALSEMGGRAIPAFLVFFPSALQFLVRLGGSVFRGWRSDGAQAEAVLVALCGDLVLSRIVHVCVLWMCPISAAPGAALHRVCRVCALRLVGAMGCKVEAPCGCGRMDRSASGVLRDVGVPEKRNAPPASRVRDEVRH